MINLLRQWTITIVTLVVIITFLEIILPKNDLKKYINVTTGFLLIITILNPFIKLLSSDINIEKEVFKNIMLKPENDFYITDEYKKYQEDQTMKLYKDKIKKHIKKTIEDTFRYKVVRIEVDIENENTENFGEIKKIKLILVQENTDFKNKNVHDKYSINIESVKEIRVNLESVETEKIENSDVVNREVEEIKKLISNNYKLPKESILIIYE
ncbi:stage III sporulation protein AF [Caloranaerobacter azorensis DSM 13643]|uniref:Stage III sporulation protein AF n=1 Tax=Caloranaerobacter azorensis DSM 13643 TaxID=1121264 RepID=A0A1M5RX63_9FIRM|nr:stage III sporulation protein AF [Caloranaerobacter azorensis]SHH30947.1 stage III sporulation protein AF [Caloranaerobacter azorensis DSM 13643]